ncbi:MAG: extracellular solute-binding protein [Chloroflexi bacterium]|nr:extracellular solute-binding protein [Chloroflexota bacterium]
MRNSKTGVVMGLSLLITFLFHSCAPEAKGPTLTPVTATVKPVETVGWEMEWEKAVSEAKREGTLVIYSADQPRLRQALTSSFKERFNINLEFTAGKPLELVTKVIAEKRARLDISDIFMGAITAAYRPLKPEGFLEDLTKDLLLPELTDPNVWLQKKLPTLPFDTEGKYMLHARASPSRAETVINTDLVREGEITSYYDLLNPKWKGRIAVDDFVFGNVSAARMVTRPLYMKTLDWDFWKALVKQEPAVVKDERLQTETVARGKYAIMIGAEADVTREFITLGAPVKLFFLKEDIQYLGIASGAIAFLTNAPHPNARKVFLNWYFSREGMTVFSRALGSQTSRVDIPTDFVAADEIRDPNKNYFLHESPEFARFELENWPIVKEIFGPLYK